MEDGDWRLPMPAVDSSMWTRPNSGLVDSLVSQSSKINTTIIIWALLKFERVKFRNGESVKVFV
jgi:hypothetical protein